MKEIYALSGRSNCGKTQTLKQVFKILKEKYPSYKMINGNENADETADNVDECVIFEITLNNKNIRIGIQTEGDWGEDLSESLDYLIKKKCNIIFCASRTKGRTTDVLWEQENKNKIWIIPKSDYYSQYDEKTINRKEALALIARAEI